MPVEVLVMCSACGRPQPAGGSRCIACGGALPDAPMPAEPSPRAPFLAADLGGGRALSGEGERLSYRATPSGAPQVVDLGSLRGLELETRFFREALLLAAFAVLGFVARAPALKAVAFGVAALGVLLAVVCRSHVLVLETSEPGRVRWPLGLARRGSERDARLLAAWDTLAGVVRARGVPVREAGARRTAPPPLPPPGPGDGPRA
ncbi:hypothetical protein [Pyxidicoccus xibeiensis]|uniref:hypothetical protein n=1 Tax=Pyxidicoccus xibeiensis TaxID=2906759 RepID=UPI0020A7EF20|nr:hypothetical protein [Pyxidicoccus xibeiensis]MCP3144779.1 hypothetical protein [Pyxidicoccus xibeiensis]